VSPVGAAGGADAPLSAPARGGVAVIGPTASGKSAVALAAAQQVPGLELISVDSMQVYRGMDIGTAKPTAQEQAAVRHHLIDLVDASDSFTVAQFQDDLQRVRADLAERAATGLYVGGTGLYLRAVIDGLTLPGEWPDIRADLEAEADRVGAPALHARLAELDPAAAEKMEPTNTRRVVRALEVCLGSGRPFSSFGPGVDTYPESRITQIALRWDREVLTRRIEERVHVMVDRGLVSEVETLLSAPGGMSRTARQALGYKEVVEHLEGACSLDEAVASIVLRTRQFAVRQERWFARDPRIQWARISTDPVAEALPLVMRALTRNEQHPG
jgi:tRNA dimethylallyltransferase